MPHAVVVRAKKPRPAAAAAMAARAAAAAAGDDGECSSDGEGTWNSAGGRKVLGLQGGIQDRSVSQSRGGSGSAAETSGSNSDSADEDILDDEKMVARMAAADAEIAEATSRAAKAERAETIVKTELAAAIEKEAQVRQLILWVGSWVLWAAAVMQAPVMQVLYPERALYCSVA